MSFTPMLSWWQWVALAAIPPAILLLYFLKLKRQPLVVPSTFLWARSIEDLHVNSIWQKLRKNLLLFLQLLLLTLAIFALLRPGWSGVVLTGNRFALLVDNSASMSASDVKPTRLAEAKRRAGELLDQMRDGDQAMLVSFANGAKVEQSLTGNVSELRKRLGAIEPSARTTDLNDALRVAIGMTQTHLASSEAKTDEQAATPTTTPATVYLFSDGRFPPADAVSLGNLEPRFVQIGEATAKNLGIVAFSTRRSEDDDTRLQAFARLENAGAEDVKAEASLLVDDQLIDAQEVTIKAGKAEPVVFDLENFKSGVLKLRISSGGDLRLDDEAVAVVDLPRRARVLLVTPGNDALELALTTERAKELADVTIEGTSVLDSSDYEKRAATGAYDLIIYDTCAPKAMPQANTLTIGARPPLEKWNAKAKVVGPAIIDVNQAHPLTQLIDLGNVIFEEGTPVVPPSGSTILIDSDSGPLFAASTREGFEDAVLGLEIVGRNEKGEKRANTDWPLRLSFPIFVLNVLEYLGGGRENNSMESVLPGAPVLLRSDTSSDSLTVRTPAGDEVRVRRGPMNTFSFTQTDQLGVYAVDDGSKVAQRFAVNLFSSAESEIPPRADATIKIGYATVASESTREPTRRELWKWLLAGALGVLLFEWYIYNRRVYL